MLETDLSVSNVFVALLLGLLLSFAIEDLALGLAGLRIEAVLNMALSEKAPWF